MSKKSLNDTIKYAARYYQWLDSTLRHLRNYQSLRRYLEEHYPGIVKEWLDETS